jgi:DNA-binding MarR family transcriptional regulator
VLPEDKTDAAFASLPFTERDIREAARLLALIASLDAGETQGSLGEPELDRQSSSVDREVLLSRAKKHFRDRQLRRQFFSRAIFGEPAWDTLLVLYISEFFGRRLTVGRLVDWIEAPLSTAQRWIAYLEKERLVAKEGHPDDRRMAYIRLLDKGRTILDDYFTAAAE